MKTLLAATLCLVSSFLIYASSPQPAQPILPLNTPITITGTLFPDETDAEGNATSIYIEVFKKEDPLNSPEYTIAPDAKGKELAKHLYHTVSVTGMLKVGPDGKNLLYIQKFEIIPSKPEDLEDEL